MKITAPVAEVDSKDLIVLIGRKDIDQAKSLFTNNTDRIQKARKQYEKKSHVINDRTDKQITLKDGNIEKIKQWKLPLTYQKKIVQSAVAFLLGKPIKIIQESDDKSDIIFKELISLRDSMRMKSIDQECAKIMFSETECVKLFVPFVDENNPTEAKLRCVLLSASKGDRIFTKYDEYGTLEAFARGYDVKVGEADEEHLDIYTAEVIYKCIKGSTWEVATEDNKLKKIPATIYDQDAPEWDDVQELIERREWLTSKRADTNDYSADPILVLTADALPSLPEKEAAGKVIHLKGAGAKAEYMFPQMSVDMVANEKEDLKELIHYLTDTPDLSMDKMSSLGLTSGKAIEMAFYGAILKAMGKQGYFEEMIDRELNILKAFLKNIVHVDKKLAIDELETSIVFGNPLPDDFLDKINMLSTAVGGKAIMSVATAVGQNPLIQDAAFEIEELKKDNIDNLEP